MAVIGAFKPTKQGGWEGSIRTLTINAKVRLVPNDDRLSDGAPAFRVMLGWSRIGDAWEARSNGDHPREYLRLRLDDPAWPTPVSAALFADAEGSTAQLVWRREHKRH
jgi:uncharacterized protein (DUF736 family)